MKASFFFFFFFCLVSLVELSHPMSSSTLVVVPMAMDGLSLAQRKTPTSLQLGDSLVFKHKQAYLQTLYHFHSRRAFDRCDFTQAAIIYDHKLTSTHFTWTPSRPGYYYLSTRDGCDKGEKLTLRVMSAAPAFPPVPLQAPPPTSGGDSSPPPSARGWGWVSSSPSSPRAAPDGNSNTSPLVPREGSAAPALAPAGAPESSGGGMPFLSSNPAVPLPTGMGDTASIRPLPTPGDGSQVVGLGCSSIGIGKRLVGFVMMFSALGLWM